MRRVRSPDKNRTRTSYETTSRIVNRGRGESCLAGVKITIQLQRDGSGQSQGLMTIKLACRTRYSRTILQ
jgi:hypothetical protein